jgi:hypothetical protein
VGVPLRVGMIGRGAISGQYPATGSRLLDPARHGAAGGRLAYHVLDVMESLLGSVRSGRLEVVASSCERPTPVALGGLADTP